MKKPAVWSRWGSVSTVAAAPVERLQAARRGAKAGSSAARSSRLKSAWESRKPAISVLVLSRGDRARRVDKHAARTEGLGAGGEDRAPASRPSASTAVRRHAPAQIGARLQRAQARARRIDEHAVERRAVGAASRGVADLDADVAGAQPRGRPRRARPARRAVALDGHAPRRAPSISAARCVVLPPGRRAQVEHALARLRAEHARDEHRRARLRDERARLPQRRVVHVERAVEHDRLGERRRRGASAPTRAARAASVAGVGARACSRAARPRRARCRTPSARAHPRRRAAPTTGARSTRGCECIDRRLLRASRRRARRAARRRPRARRGAAPR